MAKKGVVSARTQSLESAISQTAASRARLLVIRAANLAGAFAIFALIATNLSPSQKHDILVYSWGKAAFLALMLLGAAYFLVSTRSKRLSRVNGALVICLMVGVAGLEGWLGLAPQTFPRVFRDVVPDQVRWRMQERAAHGRAAATQGAGMLYSYHPAASVPEAPWVPIDAQGYRNPAGEAAARVVLLGDSLTLALDARADLGERLRQAGIPTRSLAMGGYAPQHFRDAYQRFILDAGVPHEMVVVTTSLLNDITDSHAYEAVAVKGGDWRRYNNISPPPGEGGPLVSLEFLRNLAFWLRDLAINPQTLQDHGLDDIRIKVTPPGRAAFEVPAVLLKVPAYTDEQLAAYRTALAQIAVMVKRSGAKLVIVRYPVGGDLVLRHAQIGDDEKRRFLDDAERLSQRVFAGLGEDVLVVQAGPAMMEAAADNPLTEILGDIHPNDAGVEVIWQLLRPRVTDTLMRNAMR